MFKLRLKGYIVLSKACVLFTLTQLANKSALLVARLLHCIGNLIASVLSALLVASK